MHYSQMHLSSNAFENNALFPYALFPYAYENNAFENNALFSYALFSYAYENNAFHSVADKQNAFEGSVEVEGGFIFPRVISTSGSPFSAEVENLIRKRDSGLRADSPPRFENNPPHAKRDWPAEVSLAEL